MEITQQDLDTILKLRTGEDAMDGKGPLSVRGGLAHSADQTRQGMTVDDAKKTASLVDRIQDGDDLHLELEEGALLQKNAAICFSPFISRQLLRILDPPAKPDLRETSRDKVTDTVA